MTIDLLDFARKVKHIAKQALGKKATKPKSGGLPRWTHIAVHCIRKQENYTYKQLTNRLSLMPKICNILKLHPKALPHPSTFCHSFDRFKIHIWQALLRISAQKLKNSGHVALDSTFIKRKHTSHYYIKRSNRKVKTIKVTTITDTQSLAVLDLHCCIKRLHDTKAGPKIITRNIDKIKSVAADKAFQDWHTELKYQAHNIKPLICHKGSKENTTAHNVAIRDNGYNQRWMAETTYSTIKRTQKNGLNSQSWYKQFREITLMFAINNIKKITKKL